MRIQKGIKIVAKDGENITYVSRVSILIHNQKLLRGELKNEGWKGRR
jgi:hypothetical protein